MTSLIKFECTEVCHRYNKLSIKHASHTYKCYNEPRKNQAFVCVRCIDSLLYASNSILWVTSEVNSTNNSDNTEFDSANSYDCGEIMVNWLENDAENASKVFSKFQMYVLEWRPWENAIFYWIFLLYNLESKQKPRVTLPNAIIIGVK